MEVTAAMTGVDHFDLVGTSRRRCCTVISLGLCSCKNGCQKLRVDSDGTFVTSVKSVATRRSTVSVAEVQ